MTLRLFWKEVTTTMLRLISPSLCLCPWLAVSAVALAAEPAPHISSITHQPGRVVYPTAPLPSSTSSSIIATPYAPAPASVSNYYGGYGGYAFGGLYGTPGGYEARIGSPYHYYDPNGGQYVVTGNPYDDHFGPGFHRESLHGHYRFPYYNYRAPWYYPGRAVYNRDTNFAW